ncbi:hypothetical protein CR205_12785 [Alteribacter lacisalsi]|uniref:Lipoprotein n=1 Tax=Alteribacter lacisalsi TaxID=2045244 RepID=A0A2W0H928_9BACI|nr:hypothetical protein [Alteribacter lacisalsi]PYZ96580.1 hypothetical protein CR205_12785 [Alteribacter lacisalsi]
MKNHLLVILLFMFLTACSQSNSGGSYATIVVVNNIEYGGSEENMSHYEIDKPIGKVTRKVNANQFPQNNQSNYFETDSVIYSVKNDPNFIIIENNNGDLQLLQKAPGQN